MATISTGYTWADGNVVTAALLNQSVNSAGITNVVNADISSSAAIVDSKLATISTAGKVSGSAITSGDISTSGNITTSGNLTATGSITATGGFIASSTGMPISKFLPKAWVSFRANLTAITPNTYAQSYNSTTGLTTVTISTTKSGGHGLATGDFVTITASTSGLINGTWQVSVISSTSFSLAYTGTLATITAATINPIKVNSSLNVYSITNNSTGNYTLTFGTSSQISVTALICTGTTATATAANSLTVGKFVTISGASVSGYNGTFQVTAATSTSFSYSVASTLSAATTATAQTTSTASPFADANYVMASSSNYANSATGSQGMGIAAASKTVSSCNVLANWGAYYNGQTLDTNTVGATYDQYEVSVVFFGN